MPARMKSDGFTLMELLVAMAVGSVILLAAATFLGGTGETYNRVGGNIAAEREARALVSQIADDLGTALYHEDGVFDENGAAGASWASDRIGFLSLQPESAQTDAGRIGDVCAVTYYLDDLDIDGRSLRCLMRGFRESKDVFDALSAGSVSSLFGAQDGVDEPLAFGVLAFEARPKERTDQGEWIDWVKVDGGDGPDALDVRLVIARNDLAMKLTDAGDWDGGGSFARLLGDPGDAGENKDLEVYQTMVRFGNSAE
nr:prepilin-type N-terminal cleavage/methylation domain-containing protein [Verrucomicrobiota bacterium JB025]